MGSTEIIIELAFLCSCAFFAKKSIDFNTKVPDLKCTAELQKGI
jgi:hypothetical protein